MEFFGFASGNSLSGPYFPFFPESILKSYPNELMEHPALPSLAVPDMGQLPSMYQGLKDASCSMWEKPGTRQLAMGILAAAVAYGVWKVSLAWNESIVESRTPTNFDFEIKKFPGFGQLNHKGAVKQMSGDAEPNEAEVSPPPTPPELVPVPKVANKSEMVNLMTGDHLTTATEKFQRQLMEALSRLDDVRFRLKELDGEKALLAAEIDLRKRMISKLQDENTTERDKRQQAELRMEMMGIENAQLRQLRKELSVKMGQVERLEKFLKEKEALQEKLFEDNVVMPRRIAETRAKEFCALQARIQKLEAEMYCRTHMCDLDSTCQSSRSSCSVCLKGSTVSTKSQRRSKSDRSTPVIPGDHARVSTTSNLNSITGAEISNSLSKATTSLSKAMRDKVTCPSVGSSRTTPSLDDTRSHSPETVVPAEESWKQTNHQKRKHSASEKHPKNNSSMTCTDNVDTIMEGDSCELAQKGVLAQLKALISSFRESGSDSEGGTPTETEIPCLLSGLVTGPNPSLNDIANNNVIRGEGYPLSDGQSSVFVSASDGSVASDNDPDTASRKRPHKVTSRKTSSAKWLLQSRRDKTKDKGRISKKRAAAQHHGRSAFAPTQDHTSSSADRDHSSSTSGVATEYHEGYTAEMKTSAETPTTDDTSTLESSDENEGDSGDSWIVIKPAPDK